MQFRVDRRGQAIQIGAVLLLGAIVIAFGIYQATVVPDQNREIEFKHSQTVQDQLTDARNAIVSTGSTGDGRSVSVTLGTQYPSRIIAMNPGPPSGQLSTVGTTNDSIVATIANAAATGETGDFWTGANRSYNTGSLVYRPGYNEYRNAPTTWYEHSVLFNQFRDANLTETDQRLVDGKTISLVVLNGSYQASQSGSVSLDFRGTSVSSRTVSVTNATADSNVSITLPTRLDETSWEEMLDGERHVVDVHTSPVAGEDYKRVHVVFEQGVIYDLRLSRVGVGTGVVKPGPAYLTRVDENTLTVPEGGQIDVTVEVRDRFDNPQRNVQVVAGTSRSDSTVSPNGTASNGDGQVTVTYDAPNVTGRSQRTDYVQVSLNTSLSDAVNSSQFNGSTPVNVSVPVRIDNSDGSGLGGGNSAYTVSWIDPTQTGVTCQPANDPDGVCTVDAGKTSSVTLTSGTTPTADEAPIAYAVNNSTVAPLSTNTASTNASGEATTTLTPSSNGNVIVYASSGGSGDQLEIVVENASGSANQAPTASFTYSCTGATCSFDASGSSDPDGTVQTYKWDWDNDGTFETTTGSATTSHTFGPPGTYDVTLEVVDNGGATGSTTNTVVTGGGVHFGTASTPSNRYDSVVEQTISSSRNDQITIVSVKVNQTQGSAKRIDGDRFGWFGYPELNVYVGQNNGYSSGYADGLNGYPLPATMNLQTDGSVATIGSGQAANLQFWEFRKQQKAADMNGKSTTITISYQVGGRTYTASKRVTIQD